MSLVERLKSQTKVLRAGELASLLEVTPQHIYKLAASGRMPCIRVARAIRFDPQQVAGWLLETAPFHQLHEHQPLAVSRAREGKHPFAVARRSTTTQNAYAR